MGHEDQLSAFLGCCDHSALERAMWCKDPSLVLLNEFYRHRLRCVRRRAKIAACSAEAPSLQNAWDGVRGHLRRRSDRAWPEIVHLSGAWTSDLKLEGDASTELVSSGLIGDGILFCKMM